MTPTVLAPHRSVDRCRSCGGSDLHTVIEFGTTPIADRLVAPGDPGPEYVAPLTLVHCTTCALCQILETVEPRVLFGESYPYYSSVSPALLRHFRQSAEAIIAAERLGPGDLVVEAASNDGYMLQNFHERGIPVLGVDPADGPVGVARGKGIDTIHDFFGFDVAQELAHGGSKARVFLANNVLAHVADVNDFVRGIATLLTDDGIAVIEVPYLLDLLDGGAFDTIYHQHLLYLSLSSLHPLFSRHGLHLNDVERLWIHGGSLRLFVSRREARSHRLETMLAEEAARGIGSISIYREFVDRIARLRDETRSIVERLRSEGKTLAGYGAAAKATTLMHYFGLGKNECSFIADKSQWKQGREMPVTRVPIASPDELRRTDPDAVILLAWNFADEIISENAWYLDRGGRFIVPVPAVREVSKETSGAST